MNITLKTISGVGCKTMSKEGSRSWSSFRLWIGNIYTIGFRSKTLGKRGAVYKSWSSTRSQDTTQSYSSSDPHNKFDYRRKTFSRSKSRSLVV